MATKFSSQLIERFQKHFKEKHNAEVSPAEAELYLDSFADLYLIVTNQQVGGQADPALPGTGKPDSRPP